MEQEQWFLFAVYELQGTTDWLYDEDKKIEYKNQYSNLLRVAKIKGIATDYIKHKRIKIDFDPSEIKSAWVIYAYVTLVDKKNNTEIRNDLRILAIEDTDEKADQILKKMQDGEVQYFLNKNEIYSKIEKIHLPLIDD